MASRTDPKDRYGKVARRMWVDEWFVSLGPMPCTPHTLWFALLTALPSPVPGLAPVGLGWLCDLTGWEPGDITEALAPLEAAGRVRRASRPSLLWLPNAIKHNQPSSPNTAKSWGMECAAMPECGLRAEAIAAIAQGMSEGMRRAFLEGCGDLSSKAYDKACDKVCDMPCAKECDIQEQEQEQEQEKEDFVASEAATVVADAPSLSPAQEVWEHYLSRRSRRSKMPESAAEQIRARIRSTSVESCKLVIDWSHDAPSAAHLRDNDRNRDFTRWSTIFARRNFDKYVEEAHEWDDAGRSKQAPQQAQPSQPEPTRTYQSWSWFETELRSEACRLALKAEQVTAEWAKRHPDWQTVPGWVFDRAVEATKEDRSARY